MELGGGRGVARDVMGGLQLAPVFEIGGDAGAAKGVAAHLVGVEAGVFGSPFDHMQDVIWGKTAAGAPIRRLKEWRVLVVARDVEDDADVRTESRTRPPLDLPERYP